MLTEVDLSTSYRGLLKGHHVSLACWGRGDFRSITSELQEPSPCILFCHPRRMCLPPLPADDESGVTQESEGRRVSSVWDHKLQAAGTSLDISSSKMLWPSKLCFIGTTDLVLSYLELFSFSGPRKRDAPERTKQNKIPEAHNPKRTWEVEQAVHADKDSPGWMGLIMDAFL